MMACGIWAWFGHIVQGSHHEVTLNPKQHDEPKLLIGPIL